MQLRTLHINTETRWGGGEQQTLYLLDGLRRAGHEAVLATRPASPLAERARELGIELLAIRPLNEGDPVAIWRLGRFLCSRRPHVLHMHAPHAHMLGVLAACFIPRVARVVSRRVQYSIYRPGTLGFNWLKYRFGVDRYIAVSAAVRESLCGDGVPASRVTVVHSGVAPRRRGWHPLDEDELQDRKTEWARRLDLPPSVPWIVSVGALVPVKGYSHLIDAAARVLERQDAAIVIFGEGHEAALLRDRARKLGIDHRVRLPGFRKDVLDVLAVATVFAQSSLQEGLGTSVLDALHLGVPVVATAVGGTPEILRHGQEGLLTLPGDATALASALFEVLQNDELRRRLATAGQRRVGEAFSADRMVADTVAVYRDVLVARARPR